MATVQLLLAPLSYFPIRAEAIAPVPSPIDHRFVCTFQNKLSRRLKILVKLIASRVFLDLQKEANRGIRYG